MEMVQYDGYTSSDWSQIPWSEMLAVIKHYATLFFLVLILFAVLRSKIILHCKSRVCT